MKTNHKTILDRQSKTKQDFLTHFRKTPVIEMVCNRVGLARSSLYRWLKDDKEFYQSYIDAQNEGREHLNDAMELNLIKLAKENNITAIIYYLKHNHPRYSESYGALLPQDIKEIVDYLNNFNGSPEQDRQFLSKLLEKRVPIRIGVYLVHVLRQLMDQQKILQEKKKLDFLSKVIKRK